MSSLNNLISYHPLRNRNRLYQGFVIFQPGTFFVFSSTTSPRMDEAALVNVGPFSFGPFNLQGSNFSLIPGSFFGCGVRILGYICFGGYITALILGKRGQFSDMSAKGQFVGILANGLFSGCATMVALVTTLWAGTLAAARMDYELKEKPEPSS